MDSYRKAYEPPIQPMPGPKHWERVSMRESQPPAFKVHPGRPKSKKRKLEPGECSTSTAQPQTAKRQKQCSKCAGFGHYAKTCKNTLHQQLRSQGNQGDHPPTLLGWWRRGRRKNSELPKRAQVSQAQVNQSQSSSLSQRQILPPSNLQQPLLSIHTKLLSVPQVSLQQQ
ncbi:uncharacterized protein LOC110738539 [Chenopodium quinoa]|uniref:uncharacterized protein LOC110738539 n=1 Tax=Chenopodium quinoa TaxID=63459 RepID=UPI000B7839FA|nr:uncharacterized protein LOC110738539 [Chenopodium quinoa]